MIGDRLLVEDRHLKIAKKVVSEIAERGIILLNGPSGVGKTECADCLQELLSNKGKNSLVLSLDDFYLVHPTIRNLNRKKQGIESVGLTEIDWDYLQRICDDFVKQKPIHFRRVHKYADIVEHNVCDTDTLDVLIIEGLYAGYLKKYGYNYFNIYLDGTVSQTYSFRKKRRKENPDDNFRKKVVQKEYKVICQLKKYANLIIPFEGGL